MFDLFAELSGLVAEVREHRLVLVRVAEALERLSPPLRAEAEAPAERHESSARVPSEEDVHYLSESPEEYLVRQSREAALAESLGVAPWSPELQRTIMEVRAELMKPRRYQDEQGNWQTRPELSEEEADQAVRDGFRIARAHIAVGDDKAP